MNKKIIIDKLKSVLTIQNLIVCSMLIIAVLFVSIISIVILEMYIKSFENDMEEIDILRTLSFAMLVYLTADKLGFMDSRRRYRI